MISGSFHAPCRFYVVYFLQTRGPNGLIIQNVQLLVEVASLSGREGVLAVMALTLLVSANVQIH